MSYSIGKVSKITGIAISTLRYYDREGLFPSIKRGNGGIRMFSDSEIETLRIIECLKTSGMSIKDIRQFLDWCQEGDSSLQKRRDMFYKRLNSVNKQIEDLNKTLNTIKYKCWYYDTALSFGTESAPKNMTIEEIPEEVRCYKCYTTI